MQWAAITSSDGFHSTEHPRRQKAPFFPSSHDVLAAAENTPARSAVHPVPPAPHFPKLTRPAPDARLFPVRLEESFL